jgi:acyl carrier protein
MSSLPAAAPAVSPRVHEALARLPASCREAFARYQASGDAQALDAVVLAVVREYVPRAHAPAVGEPLREDARLMEDLGFDSLAISETVFMLEDVFSVRIANAEILTVRTVGDLRAFVRQKLAARTVAKTI